MPYSTGLYDSIARRDSSVARPGILGVLTHKMTLAEVVGFVPIAHTCEVLQRLVRTTTRLF